MSIKPSKHEPGPTLKLVQSYMAQPEVMEQLPADLQDACGCLQRALSHCQVVAESDQKTVLKKVNDMAHRIRPEIESHAADILPFSKLPVVDRPQTAQEKNEVIIRTWYDRGLRTVSRDELRDAGFVTRKWDDLITAGKFTLVKQYLLWSYVIMNKVQYDAYRGHR